MPNYVRFMNKVLSKNQRFEDFETINLVEECSTILQRKLARKLKDLGSFTILYEIEGSKVGKALYDLGESINLMPLSIFESLGLGEVKQTTIML
ncbi:hypothetical protein PTKIN_Ptkin13bG0095900 [Pterospermum kingtungense]